MDTNRATLRQTSQDIDISYSQLSRYLNGVSIPSHDQLAKICEFLRIRLPLEKLVRDNLLVKNQGGQHVINTTSLITNPSIIDYVAWKIADQIKRQFRFDRIITHAVEGVPFSAAISKQLRVPYCYSTHSRSTFFAEYCSADYLQPYFETVATIHVPKLHLVSGDRYLVVADYVRLGRVVKGLLDIVEQADGIPAGIVSLAKVGDYWDDSEEQAIIHSLFVTKFDEPSPTIDTG